jgi:hypothetical protein
MDLTGGASRPRCVQRANGFAKSRFRTRRKPSNVIALPELAKVAQYRPAAEMFEMMKREGCEVSAADMTICMKSEFHISRWLSSAIDGMHDHSK